MGAVYHRRSHHTRYSDPKCWAMSVRSEACSCGILRPYGFRTAFHLRDDSRIEFTIGCLNIGHGLCAKQGKGKLDYDVRSLFRPLLNTGNECYRYGWYRRHRMTEPLISTWAGPPRSSNTLSSWDLRIFTTRYSRTNSDRRNYYPPRNCPLRKMSLAFTTFSCLCSPSLLQLDSWFSLLSINYSLRSARLLTAICLNECTSVPFFNAIFKQTSWFPPEITTIRRPKHSLVIFPVAQTHLIHPLGGILFWEGKQTPHTSVSSTKPDIRAHGYLGSTWYPLVSKVPNVKTVLRLNEERDTAFQKGKSIFCFSELESPTSKTVRR
jgi:hypothetical protein